MKSFNKENLDSFYSETFDHVDPSNPIDSVQISYRNTRTKHIILEKMTAHLKTQRHMANLFDSLLQTTANFSSLNIYKSINVKLLPGNSLNAVHLLFDFKEKSKFFASLSHYVETRSSEATLNCKLGFRNILGFAEKYTLEYEKALDKSKKSAFDFSVELPYFYKDYSLVAGYIDGKKQLTAHIDENFDSHFFKLFLNKDKTSSIMLENNLRTNHIKPKDVSEEVLNNEVIPSRKISMKYWWVKENSLRERHSKTKGDYIDHSLELTLPGSDTYFLKYEYLQRNFFHIHKLKKILPRKLFKNVNFENNFYLAFIQSLSGSRPVRMNDRLEALNVRGFREIGPKIPPQNLIAHPNVGERGYDHLGDLIGSDILIKNTHKINFYNYPILKNGNIIPFFHLTSLFLHSKSTKNDENGFFKRNFKRFSNNLRVSCGMGISANVGMGAKIEVLYNMLHWNRESDIPNNFQIRLTLND